jgi:inosine-uridine nucleoside N-ribohydrolase
MTAARPLLIDTDPGVDDAFALLLAAASPELRIEGITMVFGNAAVETTTRNALALAELAGLAAVPVVAGAAAPLSGQALEPPAHVHGRDGMGDSDARAPPSGRAMPGMSAAAFIVDAARRSRGGLSILALGPLTNLALALRLCPGLPNLVAEVVVMGGNALCPGNSTPTAEANMLADPEAADLVLGAGWRLGMVGLDVTHRVILNGEAIARLGRAAGPAGRIAARALPAYRTFFERTNGTDGIFLHDPAAVAALLAPELFVTRARPVRVETLGISRGKTWPNLGDTDDASPAP